MPASVQGGVPPCTSTTKLSRGGLKQRGHARNAAHGMALSRCWSAYQAPPLDFCWEAVVSVSGESGVPLSPSSTVSRLAGASQPAASLRGLDATGSSAVMCRRQSLRLVATAHHRLRFASRVASVSAHSGASLCARAGELHRQCFASVIQCAGAQIWHRLACASCWISRRLRLGLAPGMRGSCGTRPLRQSYITPHCSQCPPVSRKLLLWQPPLRALWVKATGVMQNCLRWSGRTAVCASRSVPALRAAVCAPLWLVWHRGISQALRALFWSVTCGQSHCVCPRPPLCFAAARHQPCALVCPSAPPRGLPQPARLGCSPCYKFSSLSRT